MFSGKTSKLNTNLAHLFRSTNRAFSWISRTSDLIQFTFSFCPFRTVPICVKIFAISNSQTAREIAALFPITRTIMKFRILFAWAIILSLFTKTIATCTDKKNQITCHQSEENGKECLWIDNECYSWSTACTDHFNPLFTCNCWSTQESLCRTHVSAFSFLLSNVHITRIKSTH